MPKEKCCGCFHIMTGAAVVGVLQAVIVVMLLSTSAILLSRTEMWKRDYDSTYISLTTTTPWTTPTTTTTPVSASTPASIIWKENGTWVWKDSGLVAFIEIHLVHHIAFYSLWLVFLAMFAMAFKSYRPALVLPNLIMQVIDVALLMILGGVIIAKLAYLAVQYKSFNGDQMQKDDLDARYASYSVLLGCLVIGWLTEIVFMWISLRFYYYLKDMQHTVYPASTVQATVAGANQQRIQHEVHAASIEVSPKIGDNMA